MRLSRELTVVDAHAGGEPGRVIVAGVLDVAGDTMFARMVHLRDHGDRLRRMVLREPRGYPALCANLILPPCDPSADAGLIIMEQAEYPPMSGSNTICAVTVLIETGMVPMVEPITDLVLDTPAGLVRVSAEVVDGRVRSVSFDNVPAFAVHLDTPVEVPEVGTVRVDVAYGGMWYAITDARTLGFGLTPDEGRDLVRIGEMIKAATREQWPVVHPENPDIAGVSIMQFSGPASSAEADMRNTVVISSGDLDWERPSTWTGVLDRSPCGTGTSARMATLHARGLLAIDAPFVHEGILGTTWTGRILRETRVGPHLAVIPRISGRGWIYARSTYVVDDGDPFPEGYMVGDLWATGSTDE